MTDLRDWLTRRFPGLLVDYERQRQEGSTKLGPEGWLILYHNEVWHRGRWRATRVEVVQRAGSLFESEDA